ncbi:MAG: hypothetical protein ABIH35_04850 [Patescibacteria group bacterium]
MSELISLTEEQILELHSILGNTDLEVCRESCRLKLRQCLGCCQDGAGLIPGESDFLKKLQRKGAIPAELKIWPSLLEGCSDPMKKECPLGDSRPYICKAYPQVKWGMISRFNHFLIFEPELRVNCPARGREGADFRNRVSRANEHLRACLGMKNEKEILIRRRH